MHIFINFVNVYLIKFALLVFKESNNFIKKSWTLTALIPAIITLVTGLCFFTCMTFQNSSLIWLASLAGTTQDRQTISSCGLVGMASSGSVNRVDQGRSGQIATWILSTRVATGNARSGLDSSGLGKCCSAWYRRK